MKKILLILILIFFQIKIQSQEKETRQNPPIYIAFLWHMHQPIYWPYESVVQTNAAGRYPFSVADIHNQRTGPYTSWPKVAVQKGINAGLGNFGAQVSFSGSLIENLNALEQSGAQNFSNWKAHWNTIKVQNTILGNPRLDMVGFGYFHPLMGLASEKDIREQIQKHKQIMSQNFSGSYSKGIFPPENAFTSKMIPALKAEGINWALIDNVHFDRACNNYPFSTSGNIYEPNKADILNPNPNDWVQLNGLWAPTKNSAQWGRQPHYVEYIDPSSGAKTKMIAVPADRYMGNEDGRGGFGALNYDAVMSQLQNFNTDPAHPILIVLHHDGDNYGGGSESYYNSNFQNFVNWVQANPSRFVCTTIEDYLEMFPPDANDIIHIENGSWSGADNGDPEFKKWLGDPDPNGYSPDRNSWGVLTAAVNYVHTAEQISSSNSNTLEAWKYLLVGQSSDYWYWDGSLNGIWDSHPTRAANKAIEFAQLVAGNDLTPPTIFVPQREPYNPGATEWGVSQTKNVTVWSYVYDISGLQSVKLKYRIDNDGLNPINSIQNETYAGGNEVGNWVELTMNGVDKISMTNPAPLKKAKEFSAVIQNLSEKLIDYFIEAIDVHGNISLSPIEHCWIGSGSGGGGTASVSWAPVNPTKNDTIEIVVSNVGQGAKLHWGVNNNGSNWQTPDSVYWPAGTVLFNNAGPAVESPFSQLDSAGTIKIKIGPFNYANKNVERVAFVIHFNDNTWNNNNGQDFIINIGGGGGQSFVMDGTLDGSAQQVVSNSGMSLYLGWNGAELYVATQSALSQSNDVFIFVSDSLRSFTLAPWAKGGQVSAWSLFLANESTNNWAGWFDQTSAYQKAAGAFLEGSFNVVNEFGYLPAKLYISVGAYQTQDGGILANQVPAGNSDGNIDANEFFVFDYTLTATNDNDELPETFALYQNYPNPFNPSTVIKYSVGNASAALSTSGSKHLVTLKVFDILGREVAMLVNEEKEPGVYHSPFSIVNSPFPSGVYFYQLRVGENILSKKMTLLK